MGVDLVRVVDLFGRKLPLSLNMNTLQESAHELPAEAGEFVVHFRKTTCTV